MLEGTDIRPWLTMDSPEPSDRTVTSSRPIGVPLKKMV
jgi:hypothetical protein